MYNASDILVVSFMNGIETSRFKAERVVRHGTQANDAESLLLPFSELKHHRSTRPQYKIMC